jgi:hypothetical protein
MRPRKRDRVLNSIDDDLHNAIVEIIKLKGTENESLESDIDLIDKAEIILQLISNP